MRKIPQYVCGVIPPHILARVAERARGGHDGCNARATIEHMREVATGQVPHGVSGAAITVGGAAATRKRRRVYDARRRFTLPGRIARDEGKPKSGDVVVNEAYDGSGAVHDFFARVFHRNSIDGAGMRLDSTVHYGRAFGNAMWNGEQIVYGDGDGRIFGRFTSSLDVIGHELTHGLTQFAASLEYHGETGALNEHLSDAFGIMVKQYKLGQTVDQSDWLIGAEILGPDVNGVAIRSMIAPGTAYDDPLLGRDPQPWHMRDYVETDEDNGGVHINSGILNHGFYRAAEALGGRTWEVLGRIWYAVVTDRLGANDTFRDFTRATVDVAGELYGNGSVIQRAIARAWCDVGLEVRLVAPRIPIRRRRDTAAAIAAALPSSASNNTTNTTDTTTEPGDDPAAAEPQLNTTSAAAPAESDDFKAGKDL